MPLAHTRRLGLPGRLLGCVQEIPTLFRCHWKATHILQHHPISHAPLGPMRNSWFYALAFCSALLMLSTLPASAVLGGNANSIASDQAHLQASTRITPGQRYSIHEMRTPAGTTIREFASPDGTVFAVSWQGFAPDLQQLLGDYFSQYVREAGASGQRGRGVHVETDDLVVETGGHMRFVVGRAYLKSKLPSGVDEHDIR